MFDCTRHLSKKFHRCWGYIQWEYYNYHPNFYFQKALFQLRCQKRIQLGYYSIGRIFARHPYLNRFLNNNHYQRSIP